MNDLISRQDAIDVLEKGKDITAKGEVGGFYNAIVQHNIDKIKQLPSAEPPERKRGRWLEYTANGTLEYMCSECGAKETNPKIANFCWCCGARMETEHE